MAQREAGICPKVTVFDARRYPNARVQIRPGILLREVAGAMGPPGYLQIGVPRAHKR